MAKLGRLRLTGRRLMLISLSGLVYLFLIACAVLTFQVYYQLSDYRTAEADNVSYTVTRVEVDHARLILAAQTLSVSPEATQGQAIEELRRRFDAFYSRVAILREGMVYTEVLQGTAEEALARIAQWLEQLVPIMDGPDAVLREAAPQIEAQARDLSEDVSALARAGITLDVDRVEVRRERLTATLTKLAVLSTLMLMAMVMLMVQLWRLYKRYRRRALENRATLQRVSTILNTALDTIVVVDGESRIVDANATAEATFDLRADDGSLKTIDAVLLRKSGGEDAAPAPVSGKALIRSCLSGPNRCSKLLARDKFGKLFPVEMSADIAWQDGQQVCVCYLRDISRRLEAETEMQAARDRALAGEQAQARFLGMISHEMRTPLNGILGTLDLLEDTALSEEQKRYARIIQSAGQQLLTQINDALDLTQAGAGEISLNVAPFDVDALIEEALAGQTPLAEAMGTTLRVRRQGGPLGLVEGDRARVLQVLVNLVSNAVKFTRGGEVTVDAVRPDPASPLIEVQVADTGCGIAEADLPRIFDDFVRIGHPDNDEVPGTGLGLGIVRELVTVMGGTVGAESIPGEGSLFWVSLPLPSAKTVLAGPGAEHRPAAAVPPQRHGVPPLDILVVDDNEANRFVLCEMLRKDGHAVHAVDNGIDAVKAAQAYTFDLILMDVRMPRMDGVSAARSIRGGNGASKAARLLFLTAHIDTEAPGQFQDLGVEAVLPKPLRRAALREALAGRLGAATQKVPAPTGAVDIQVLTQLRDTLRVPTFASMLGRFIAEGERFMADLPDLRNGSSEALTTALHHFTGSAATFGAASLQAALGEAEAALRAQDTARAGKALQALPALWAKTMAELQEHRDAA